MAVSRQSKLFSQSLNCPGFAAFTLFQLITLDDWFLMYSEVQQKHPDYWHILIYLVTFIVLENFIFINLFIAVIVDNLERFVQLHF